MVVNDEHPPSVQVVIALEATANMVSHWDIIRKQYIMPAIQYFHQQTTKNDDFLSILNGNCYALVLFHAADRKPESATECIPPTTNLKKFIEMLDNIQLNGGGGEHYSYITEGLATVMQLYEDLSVKRQNKNVEKYCFLVANTPPYQMPSVESFNYAGLTCQQLAEKLRDINVKMSVICPRHISELQQIYLANNNQDPLMNYAQDRCHLVLISGFRLPTEKEPIPVAEVVVEETMTENTVENETVIPMEVTTSLTQTAVSSTSTSIPMNADSAMSKPLFSPPTNIPIQNSNIFDTNITTSTVKLVIDQNPASSTLSNNSTSQLVLSNSAITPIVGSYTNVPNNPVSNSAQDTTQSLYTTPMVAQNQLPALAASVPPPNNFVDVSSGSSVQKANPSSTYHAAQAEANKVVEMVSQITPPQMPPAAPQDNTGKIIWQGILEWTEKRPTPSNPHSKTIQNIACQMIQTTNLQQPINAAHWSNKLSLQIIPQRLITAVHQYIKGFKQFHIRFPTPNVQVLVNTLTQKRGHGLIQFPSPQQPDTKVIILVFLKKKDDKNQFIGLLPNDCMGFFNALKTVLNNMQNKRPTDNPAIVSQTQDTSGQVRLISNTIKASGSSIQTGQPRYPQVRPYPSTQIRLTSAQPRVNAPGSSTSLGNVQRMVNVPTLSHHLPIRPQSATTMIRSQISGNTKGLGGIQTINSVGGNVQIGNLTPTQAAMSSSSGTMPQRMMSNVTRVTIANNTKHGLMQMQQRRAMQGNQSATQETTHLRDLLGNNNTNMQQDVSRNRQANTGNMPQQNYIQRGNNVMPGLSNQRRF